MSIVLPSLGVAFAAFCVWLAVRIVNRRERWAKWTLAIVVGLPALYVASFGPPCWIASRDRENSLGSSVHYVYWPIGWLAVNSGVFGDALFWYAEVGMKPIAMVYIPIDSSGNTAVTWSD